MFRKAFLWSVFIAAVLMLLFYYYGASDIDYAITVNGEEIHGLQEVAFATGGLLVAILAVVGILALAALILAGASMVLLVGVFAFCFLGLLFLVSPLWAPFAGIAVVIAFACRKRKDTSPVDKRCW